MHSAIIRPAGAVPAIGRHMILFGVFQVCLILLVLAIILGAGCFPRWRVRQVAVLPVKSGTETAGIPANRLS